MKLATEEKPEGVPTLRFVMDGSRGKVDVDRMFVLKKKKTGEEIEITKDNVDSFDIKPWLKEVEIEMVGDPEEMRYLYERLQERGMKFIKPFEYKMLSEVMPKEGQVLVETTGLVDNTIKRAITKILFNFVAYYIGTDVVVSPEWNMAREYIRNGIGRLECDVKRGVFWDIETEHIHLEPPGTNIRIENKNGSVWGYIQFFNMMIYEVKLASGYTIPENKLIGGKFSHGEEPLILKPIRIRTPLYIAQYDVDIMGRPSIKIQGYGGAK